MLPVFRQHKRARYPCMAEKQIVFRLRDLRLQRHMTQTRLAIELNMEQNSISRYERGEREADYRTLIQLADYFGVSIDYLLGRTDQPKMNR